VQGKRHEGKTGSSATRRGVKKKRGYQTTFSQNTKKGKKKEEGADTTDPQVVRRTKIETFHVTYKGSGVKNLKKEGGFLFACDI